ncbi:hypothetical protein Avbf_19105 [Armadillidium vulgare]|nr:hypothetical protein Avbf_19105 [Armadillidium vulgare]
MQFIQLYDFMTLSVMKHSKKRDLFDTLISNLGGNLGLFVGMSIVSMVELVVFIIDLTSQSLKKKGKVHETSGKSRKMDTSMEEGHSNVRTAWSEEKKEKARNYFSQIFYDEE